MTKSEELRRLADVAAQVLRDMRAQGVLIEWDTQLDDALREYAESLEREPVASGKWEGAEYWMPLAWELCAEEGGEESCNELLWCGGPIKEPWGDRWLQYEDEAKRLIALVSKHAPTHPPRSEPPKMTEAEIEAIAHRKAWRFKHSSDPAHSDTYTFNGHTLQDFAAAICELRDKQWRGEV